MCREERQRRVFLVFARSRSQYSSNNRKNLQIPDNLNEIDTVFLGNFRFCFPEIVGFLYTSRIKVLFQQQTYKFNKNNHKRS